MKHALDDMRDEENSKREKTEPCALIEHVMGILRVFLKAFLNECWIAGGAREQVVKPALRC